MKRDEKPTFYLNLPSKRRTTTQVCNWCRKEYKTHYPQQRYCNDPCKALTAAERVAGITDAVRRGEAVAVPNPDLYKKGRKSKNSKPRSVLSGKESPNELSRKWLSIRL